MRLEDSDIDLATCTEPYRDVRTATVIGTVRCGREVNVATVQAHQLTLLGFEIASV